MIETGNNSWTYHPSFPLWVLVRNSLSGQSKGEVGWCVAACWDPHPPHGLTHLSIDLLFTSETMVALHNHTRVPACMYYWVGLRSEPWLQDGVVARKRAHARGFSWLLKGWKGIAELPQACAVQSSSVLCLGALYGMTVRPLVQRCDDTKEINADNDGLAPRSPRPSVKGISVALKWSQTASFHLNLEIICQQTGKGIHPFLFGILSLFLEMSSARRGQKNESNSIVDFYIMWNYYWQPEW